MSSLSFVEKSGSTGLEHLTDEELKNYAQMVMSLSPRDLTAIESGYDSKAMYHVVRLLGEIEQILIEHDLDLERNREQLKSIRRGEWTLDQIETYFHEKERHLEGVYAISTLPHSPDEAKIKGLLMNCLEAHYGSLDKVLARDASATKLVAELQAVLDRYR